MDKKFRPKGNILGILTSFFYLMIVISIAMYQMPISSPEKMSWNNYVKGSIVATVYTIGIVLAVLGAAFGIAKGISYTLEYLSESYEEYKETNFLDYDMKDAIISTVYWVNKTVDFIMSIFVPGAIALFYFGNHSVSATVEGLTNLVIMSLLPTMILLKIGEYLKAIIFEIFEIVKFLFRLLVYSIKLAFSFLFNIKNGFKNLINELIDKGK